MYTHTHYIITHVSLISTSGRVLIGCLIFIFRKSCLCLVSLLRKMICNLGDPMSLRHPVLGLPVLLSFFRWQFAHGGKSIQARRVGWGKKGAQEMYIRMSLFCLLFLQKVFCSSWFIYISTHVILYNMHRLEHRKTSSLARNWNKIIQCICIYMYIRDHEICAYAHAHTRTRALSPPPSLALSLSLYMQLFFSSSTSLSFVFFLSINTQNHQSFSREAMSKRVFYQSSALVSLPLLRLIYIYVSICISKCMYTYTQYVRNNHLLLLIYIYVSTF